MSSHDPERDPRLDPDLADGVDGYDDDASAWDDDEVVEVDARDDDAAGPDLGDLGDDEELDPATLAAFGFDVEDLAVFDDEDDELLPVVAIVGRPNVGKSTLVNRVLGRREAVVEDVPGVTRDRVTYEGDWSGHRFLMVDTGGWEREAKGMAAQVAAQAERAMFEADVILFVLDATVGATDADEDVVRLLRKTKKPVVLVANKVDDARGDADAAMLWSLGLGEPYGVSSLHGRGFGELLDAVVAALPEEGSRAAQPSGPRRVALLGKPNVGKSSLLNKLAGENRVVVDSVAGTTVDPVDELVEIAGTTWRFVDTAGIRKRVNEASGHEYYASLRTRAALDKAEVAVVLLESHEPLAEQDTRILSMVVESGRALVLAYNKWDLMDDERRRYLEREIERDLHQVSWAPRVNLSARTGRHTDKLVPALETALEGWESRVPTSRLNAFLASLVASHPHPVRGGKQPRILFGTQATTRPPTFVLFTSGFLEAGYRRFVERRLREEFGFAGTPIRIQLRVRTKRQRR
ncbi:MAG TPA: ribosome biogenesis GTPase Der [Candidatus Nanopelagicales bacterium]|nr:ribosome biogenesis GTPase Der [Candidatus Nanopelagicales bacterium]